MQVDHFDNNLARNRNKVTGELEINPIMRFLGKRPEYVEEAYGRDLRATPDAKKLIQAGGSLKNNGKFLSVNEVAERSDLAASDIGQKAQLLNIPIEFGTDSAISLAGKVERKSLRNDIEELGGVAPEGATASRLRNLKNQAKRQDNRSSAIFEEGTKQEIKAKSLGLGKGATAEEIRNAEGFQTYGSNYDASLGSVGNQQAAALRQTAALNDVNFHSKGQQYLRHDNDRKFAFTKERAGRSDFESDRSFADTIKARNQAIDMEVMRMENANEQMRMKYEYQQEADQQSMIGNLLGGLFSLGSLL